jgi:uncharacterized membrane protein
MLNRLLSFLAITLIIAAMLILAGSSSNSLTTIFSIIIGVLCLLYLNIIFYKLLKKYKEFDDNFLEEVF